jgi:hypothetical protein
MRPIAATLFAILLAAGTVSPPPALAASHPRVQGQSCPVLAKSMGRANVWNAWFHGARENIFEEMEYYSAAPCFRTGSDCKNWLYWAQSDWPRDQLIRFCRRGLR